MRKYWLPRCTTEGSSWLLKVMKSGSLWGPRMKFNACLLWKSITAHKLGGLLVINGRGFDGSEGIKWALLHSPPSPLLPVFPHTNRNTLTYFVSSHKKGVLCKIIYYFPPTSACASFRCCALVPALTLKSHKVAGLFGLPTDDAYAILQAQDALNGHGHSLSLQLQVSNQNLHPWSACASHLCQVKILRVCLLASQPHGDEDDDGPAVCRGRDGPRLPAPGVGQGSGTLGRLPPCCWGPVAIDDISTVHYGGSIAQRSHGGLFVCIHICSVCQTVHTLSSLAIKLQLDGDLQASLFLVLYVYFPNPQ